MESALFIVWKEFKYQIFYVSKHLTRKDICVQWQNNFLAQSLIYTKKLIIMTAKSIKYQLQNMMWIIDSIFCCRKYLQKENNITVEPFVKRVHMLKYPAFFTNHWYYIDSPKYKSLLQLSHQLNLPRTKHWPMNHKNEVKVRWTMPGRHVQLTILPNNNYSWPIAYS